jgi:hypothetical protein
VKTLVFEKAMQSVTRMPLEEYHAAFTQLVHKAKKLDLSISPKKLSFLTL